VLGATRPSRTDQTMHATPTPPTRCSRVRARINICPTQGQDCWRRQATKNACMSVVHVPYDAPRGLVVRACVAPSSFCCCGK
jgi:hypothetical protein